MPQKVYGVLRVFNTITNGAAAAGLEAGSAVLSAEATKAVLDYYPDGMVAITNHHVVGEQKKVMLNFHFNQVAFPATVLKVFPQSDIAFLHISITTPQFKLANADRFGKQRPIQLICGSKIVNPTFQEKIAKVVSVGFPLGTSHQTLSKGNITAMGNMGTMCGDVAYYHDCVINPGNSGGALLHAGSLIGINTAIMNPGQFNTVSIARPFESIRCLIKYLVPERSHPELSPEAFRQLLSMYHVYAPPDALMNNFEAHKCGGVKKGNVAVTFSDWFNEHCLDKPDSHALLQEVLSHLLEDPDKIHALREDGWQKCGDCSTNCEIKPSIVNPERVVFNEYFSISPTDPLGDRLVEKYGKQGVVITDVHPHESLEEGQVLVGINGRALDNFGNFVDNGAPYFTAFKYRPGKKVRLNIASDEGMNIVAYTYDRLSKLPRIHEPLLTPYTAQQVLKIGGLYVTQMNASMAKNRYPKYLKPPHNDSVVGVVVRVDSDCAAWNIQRIQPGFLLTKVNGKALEGSILESLTGAKYLTFQCEDKSIIKLV